MSKILFPTDFSKTAENAFIYALKMCEKMKASLVVLNTFNLPILTGGVPPHSVEELEQNASLTALEDFKEQTAKLRQIAAENGVEHLDFECVLEEGSLIEAIQQIVIKENIDMVVMGTTGNSGFENKIFGSNTLHVMNNIDVPLLVVPHHAKYDDVDIIGFTNVYDEEDHYALKNLLEISKKFQADIKVVYVNDGKKQISPEVKQKWNEEFAQDSVYFFEKEGKNVPKTLMEFVTAEGVDIMCVVARNKTFFQRIFETSFTEKMMYHQTVPLLVYKE